MPTYEYECKQCENQFEIVKPVCEWSLPQICPDCGNIGERLISKTAIQCDSANDVSWLKSAEQVIKPQYEKTWDSRKDYKDCLKRNNLVPIG